MPRYQVVLTESRDGRSDAFSTTDDIIEAVSESAAITKAIQLWTAAKPASSFARFFSAPADPSDARPASN